MPQNIEVLRLYRKESRIPGNLLSLFICHLVPRFRDSNFVVNENQKYGKNLETKAAPFLILSLHVLIPQEVTSPSCTVPHLHREGGWRVSWRHLCSLCCILDSRDAPLSTVNTPGD